MLIVGHIGDLLVQRIHHYKKTVAEFKNEILKLLCNTIIYRNEISIGSLYMPKYLNFVNRMV